jgi:hypothetical protein
VRTAVPVKALGEVFRCTPRVEGKHPKLGVLKYEFEYDAPHERISLSVLPVACEVNVDLFTKKPPRFIRLSLGDVSKLRVATEDEGQKRVEVHFGSEEVQTLTLRLSPVVMLLWGNQSQREDDRPPWERD